MKLLEHGAKVVERRLHNIMTGNKMQLGFMPEKQLSLYLLLKSCKNVLCCTRTIGCVFYKLGEDV